MGSENSRNIFKQRSDLDDVPWELIIPIHITKGENIWLGLIVLSSEGRKTQAFSFSPLHLQSHMPTPPYSQRMKFKTNATKSGKANGAFY